MHSPRSIRTISLLAAITTAMLALPACDDDPGEPTAEPKPASAATPRSNAPNEAEKSDDGAPEESDDPSKAASNEAHPPIDPLIGQLQLGKVFEMLIVGVPSVELLERLGQETIDETNFVVLTPDQASADRLEKEIEKAGLTHIDDIRPYAKATPLAGLEHAEFHRILVVNMFSRQDTPIELARELKGAVRQTGKINIVDLEVDVPQSGDLPPKKHRWEADDTSDFFAEQDLNTSLSRDDNLPNHYLVRAFKDEPE
jgi:hypothetical protein